MQKMLFSKRIVFVYTLIVLVPLFLLITGITYFIISKEGGRIKDAEVSLLNDKCEKIEEAKNSFDLIESITLSDVDLSLFLARPESSTEEELIDTILTKANYLEQVCAITPEIYAIRIFPNSNAIPERWPIFLNYKRIEGEEKLRWAFDYRANYLGNMNALQLPSFCTTRPITKGIKECGWIQISYRMTDVFSFLYDQEDKNAAYLIVKIEDSPIDVSSNDGTSVKKIKNSEKLKVIKESIYYDEKTLTDRQFEILANRICNNSKNKILTFGSLKKHLCWQYISDIDIYVIKITSLEDFKIRFLIISFIVLVAFVVTSLALFFVIRYASEKMMSGIYSVMDGMKQVKEGNYSVQIPVNGIDEVSETQGIFNSMTQQLASQIELIKTEQELIADTEMKAMQNQINAHFLYNVLETIRMQAVLADEDEISDSLQILGRMMRYCLRWRIHRVSLAQEIDYIRSYIYILNVRNDYVISLDIEIPEEYMEIEIPKMTLQPLIENAFVHAIEKEEKDASLKVFSAISEDKTRIVLSVQDFGCGMSEDQVNQLNSYLKNDTYEKEANKGSIGLKNIQQRLTVFYGSDYRIDIKSKVGEGTTISVPVPLKKISQNTENKEA